MSSQITEYQQCKSVSLETNIVKRCHRVDVLLLLISFVNMDWFEEQALLHIRQYS